MVSWIAVSAALPERIWVLSLIDCLPALVEPSPDWEKWAAAYLVAARSAAGYGGRAGACRWAYVAAADGRRRCRW